MNEKSDNVSAITNHKELSAVISSPVNEMDMEGTMKSGKSIRSVRKYEIQDQNNDMHHDGGVVKQPSY